jgi:hypothetical protein
MSKRKKVKVQATQLITAYQGKRSIDHLLRKGLSSVVQEPKPFVSDAIKRAKEINEGEKK